MIVRTSLRSFLLILYVSLVLTSFVFLKLFIPSVSHSRQSNKVESVREIAFSNWSPSLAIPLVTVVCGGTIYKLETPLSEEIYTKLKRQKEQIRVLLGTLLYFSTSSKWKIFIITDTQETYDTITEGLNTSWPSFHYHRLQLERKQVHMPEDKNITKLLHHYRPCAWQKLFLDLIFPNLDSIVFIDSDVVFTGPAEDLWNVFAKFNATQGIAASPEPWYIKDDNRPYAGTVGINTGVLALNLTRLKKLPGGGLGYAVAQQLTNVKDPPRHDQDMVNIVLRKNSQFLYEMTHKWNFIPSDCSSYALPCNDCVSDGISIVHGADAVFYRTVDGRYKALYSTLLQLTEDLKNPAEDILLLYQGRLEGSELFFKDFICSHYKTFFNMTSHHLRKMATKTHS